MPRHRRKRSAPPATQVLVTCHDSYHHDEDGYPERGYHLVGEIRHDPGQPGGLAWTGHVPEQGRLRTSGITLMWGASPTLPVKRYRRDDGQPTYRFRCSCGLDKQRSEPELAAIVTAWVREFPGRPVEIDMCRL